MLYEVDLGLCFLWQQLDPPEEEQLSSALQSMEVELGKLGEIVWLYHILQPNDEEVSSPSKCSHTDEHMHTQYVHYHWQLSVLLLTKSRVHTCFAHLYCNMSPGNGRAV